MVARTVDNVKKSSLHEFVKDNIGQGTEINTDETGLENHKAVKHLVGEYVVGNVQARS